MAKKRSRIFKSTVGILIAALLLVTAYFGSLSMLKTLYPLRYDEFVESYTEEYNLKKSFVYAVIKCESNFQKDAVSSVGAMGLMQIMPETFEWLQTKTGEELSEELLFDENTNIKYGCLFYELLLEKFKSKEAAIAAYHAGIGNVSKWLKNEKYSSDGVHLDEIPFASTKAYVERVIKTEQIYEKLYNIK